MIKKTTVAVFNDGSYKGQYDWSGGIPLSIGEYITVDISDGKLVYIVSNKTTVLSDNGQDQNVITSYFFDLKN